MAEVADKSTTNPSPTPPTSQLTMKSSFFPASEVRRKWWKESVAYQIYPRSYQDSNGDGVGDIRGKFLLTKTIKSIDCY